MQKKNDKVYRRRPAAWSHFARFSTGNRVPWNCATVDNISFIGCLNPGKDSKSGIAMATGAAHGIARIRTRTPNQAANQKIAKDKISF